MVGFKFGEFTWNKKINLKILKHGIDGYLEKNQQYVVLQWIQ